MILPPARPTISFAPTASGCQCVLNSVLMRSLPVAAYTSRSSASALPARPPSTSKAPSSPRRPRTLQPAPPNKNRPPPRSVVVIGALCARAASIGSSAPPSVAALAPRNRRREIKLLAAAGLRRFVAGLRCFVRIDRGVHGRLADGPNVRPHALRRAEHRPYRLFFHLHPGTQLAQQRRLLLEERGLDRP